MAVSGVASARSRLRDYLLLLTSFATSRVGDFLYLVALSVYVYERTGSAAWVSAAALSRLIPYTVLSAPAALRAAHPGRPRRDRRPPPAAGDRPVRGALDDGRRSRRGLPPFGLGIGLCTGEVAAAFLGSDERVEYTVVGDTVNLAARLTDAARPAGTTVASSATVAGAAPEAWSVVGLEPFRVKGRTTAVSAYRVAARESVLPGSESPAAL